MHIKNIISILVFVIIPAWLLLNSTESWKIMYWFALTTLQEDFCQCTFLQRQSMSLSHILVIKRSSCHTAFPWGQLMAKPRDSGTHTQQDKATAHFMPLCLCCTFSCSTAILSLSCTRYCTVSLFSPFYRDILLISYFLLCIPFKSMFVFPASSFSSTLVYHHQNLLCQPICYLSSLFPAPPWISNYLASLSLWLKRLWNFPQGKATWVCFYKVENGLVFEGLIFS